MRSAGPSLHWSLAPRVVAGAVLAACVFWIAFDDGSYGVTARATVAILAWWAVVLVLAFRLVNISSLPGAALAVGGLLVSLSLWTLASMTWAPSAEEAFSELNRTTLYLGIFVLVLLLARRRDLGRWCDSLTVAIVAIAGVALVSRLFPGALPDRGLAAFLPSAATRLSYPLGYWNGLAVFVSLGVPLLLRLALVGQTALRRGAGLAPLPALAATIYLTSSRGGVATALLAALVFLALTERRWVAAAAVVAAGAGAIVAIAVLLPRSSLVNGPLDTDVAQSQSRVVAILLALLCATTGVAWGLGSRLLRGRVQPSRWVGLAALVAIALAVLVAVALAHPARRFEDFKRLPESPQAIGPGDFVRAHLLSGNGSGRWQFWSVALDGWKRHPFEGLGAGAYEHWWSEHARFTYFVRDAHSLYAEMLAELGIVGFALVVAVLALGLVEGCRRALGASGEDRVTVAALTAVLGGYALAAGVDWMWELTAVSVIAVVALALLTGPATMPAGPPRAVAAGELRPRWARFAFGLGVTTMVVGWVAVSAQAMQLLSDRAVGRSEDAARVGDLAGAAAEATVAHEIEPWAATPYLQLALVRERSGDFVSALAHIDDAIARSPQDWRLWLVAARLETKLGHVTEAEIRLRRAAALNPRSPLFAGLFENGGNE